MPTVTSFEPAAVLGKNKDGHNILGLNKTDKSITDAIIHGTGFEASMPVNVTFGSISWSGNLDLERGSTERATVTLTCSNTSSGMGDPEDVSVTVGSGLNKSPAKPFTVEVGTPTT